MTLLSPGPHPGPVWSQENVSMLRSSRETYNKILLKAINHIFLGQTLILTPIKKIKT